MANIKSNAKSILTSKKANLRNRIHKSKFKTITKKITQAIEEKSPNLAKLSAQAYKIVDSGVAKGVWHKNNGSRKKSKLAQKIAKTLS